MKKIILVVLAIALFASVALAQVTAGATKMTSGAAGSVAPTVDVLGAHNNYGRGCAGCHVLTAATAERAAMVLPAPRLIPNRANALLRGNVFSALWPVLRLQRCNHAYTANSGKYVFVAPSGLVGATAQGYSDIRGIVMCLPAMTARLPRAR